ncbi:hypothetical protein, partial [Burkholderia singularis]|uniref:hypothetical protein n=1 Tax=Burkholderia singularis TaxID=1503053 RepID=UPI001C43B196
FALNAAECVRRVLFVIFRVPLPALSPAQALAALLIQLSEFARPLLSTKQSNLPIYTCASSTGSPVTVSIPVGTSVSKHVSKVVAVTYTSLTPPPELLNGMPD